MGRRNPWEEGFDFTPPSTALPVGAPDFVGVGAPQCGTAWWYGLVEAHPDVAGRGARPIGLHYFSHYARREFTDADRERYHRWFPRRPGQVVGEWTAGYAAEPWVPPLLAEAAPAARLLFLVRDPVERFRHGLAHIAQSRVGNVGVALADIAERGFYGAQLRSLLEHFPAEQILVLQLERCADDADGQLATTNRFLGLDDSHRPGRAVRRVESPAPPLEPSVMHRLAEMYAADAQDLASLVPDFDPDRWPTLRGPNVA